MGIKLKVTDEDKSQMANFVVEERVLINLAKERRLLMNSKAQDILTTNSLSPKLYAMSFNAAKDMWEAQLKPDALAIPVPGGNPVKATEN